MSDGDGTDDFLYVLLGQMVVVKRLKLSYLNMEVVRILYPCYGDLNPVNP